MLKERSLRLLLPAAAGIVLVCPLIKYFELRSGLSMGLYGFVELMADPRGWAIATVARCSLPTS